MNACRATTASMQLLQPTMRLAQTAAFRATEQPTLTTPPLPATDREPADAISPPRVTAAQLERHGRQRADDTVLHLALNPRIALDLNFASLRRRYHQRSFAPPSEKLLEARLHWRHPSMADGAAMPPAARGSPQTTRCSSRTSWRPGQPSQPAGGHQRPCPVKKAWRCA